MLDRDVFGDEFIKEAASVGGDYGLRIEKCIEELERIQRAVRYLEYRVERARGFPKLSLRLLAHLRKRFQKTRHRAMEYRRYLIIYREAIGLIKHREVYEVYNIERFHL